MFGMTPTPKLIIVDLLTQRLRFGSDSSRRRRSTDDRVGAVSRHRRPDLVHLLAEPERRRTHQAVETQRPDAGSPIGGKAILRL